MANRFYENRFNNIFQMMAHKYGVDDYLVLMFQTFSDISHELELNPDDKTEFDNILQRASNQQGTQDEIATDLISKIKNLGKNKYKMFKDEFLHKLELVKKRESTFIERYGGKTKKRRVKKQQRRKSKYLSSKNRRRSGKSKRRL